MQQKIPVLIIEDDKGLTELVKMVLAPHNLSLTVVHSGNDAIGYLKHNSTHLMVVDFSLPDFNASELVDELKKQSINVPPFVVTTCQGDERIAVEMMKTGARDYLTKDFKFLENLPGTIKRVLNEIEAEATYKEKTAQNVYHDVIGNALANLDALVFCLSAEGFFLWINKAVESIGYNEEELLGKHFLHIIDKADWAIISNSLIDLLSDQKCKALRFNVVTKAGHSRKMVMYLNAGTNAEGNIIVGVIHENIGLVENE